VLLSLGGLHGLQGSAEPSFNGCSHSMATSVDDGRIAQLDEFNSP
jgi:hypothetical protein